MERHLIALRESLKVYIDMKFDILEKRIEHHLGKMNSQRFNNMARRIENKLENRLSAGRVTRKVTLECLPDTSFSGRHVFRSGLACRTRQPAGLFFKEGGGMGNYPGTA